jgi:hypothetical protein
MHLKLLISSHILCKINRQTSMNYILLSKKMLGAGRSLFVVAEQALESKTNLEMDIYI